MQCLTVEGLELTRVSLINGKLETIYGNLINSITYTIIANELLIIDSFVLPYNKILNYNTQYSGITEESLADVTKRLEDVQKDVLNLISDKTVSFYYFSTIKKTN